MIKNSVNDITNVKINCSWTWKRQVFFLPREPLVASRKSENDVLEYTVNSDLTFHYNLCKTGYRELVKLHSHLDKLTSNINV